MKHAAAAITAIAKSEGEQLDDVALYSNYALADTPLERLYLDNLPRLRILKKKFDPHNSGYFLIYDCFCYGTHISIV